MLKNKKITTQKTTIIEKSLDKEFFKDKSYKFIHNDCLSELSNFPSNSVNCVITSPPYWKMREYDISIKNRKYMIGNESAPEIYRDKLINIFSEVKRILVDDGSLWLNIGDKYMNKDMIGLPWMVALALKQDGWILRNDIIWNKMKGTQSSKDRLRMIHEYIFHFVKSKSYFYDRKAILCKPKKKPMKLNGRFVSYTGVSGTKYRKIIKNSKILTIKEKNNALKELDSTIKEMQDDKIIDFRMYIRGQQRVYHSNKKSISGRAKELEQKGFFMIKTNSGGFPPNTIWNIVPEDTWRTDDHHAVFPIELLKIPINSTCPKNGIILDPFMGTGSTIKAAIDMGRRGIGIELSNNYIKVARQNMLSSNMC